MRMRIEWSAVTSSSNQKLDVIFGCCLSSAILLACCVGWRAASAASGLVLYCWAVSVCLQARTGAICRHWCSRRAMRLLVHYWRALLHLAIAASHALASQNRSPNETAVSSVLSLPCRGTRENGAERWIAKTGLKKGRVPPLPLPQSCANLTQLVRRPRCAIRLESCKIRHV